MNLTIEWIRRLFNAADYDKGKIYYQQNRVQGFDKINQPDFLVLHAIVRGTKKYKSMACIPKKNPEQLTCACECPHFRETQRCKHLVALLLTYVCEVPADQQVDFPAPGVPAPAFAANPSAAKKQQSQSVRGSDPAAKLLLAAYLELSQPSPPAGVPEKPVHLQPIVQLRYRSGYPILRLQIGRERMYAVRSIYELLARVKNGDVFSYGRQLEFRHSWAVFDEEAQCLLRLLMDEFPVFRSFSSFDAYNSHGASSRSGSNKNEIELIGGSFDRFFDLYENRSLSTDLAGVLELKTGDPPVSAQVAPSDGGMTFSVTCGASFFGNPQALYALTKQGTLLRCGEPFRQKVYPLLQGRTGSIRFGPNDLPAFCSCILPEIEAAVPIRDEAGLLKEYLPDECTVRFYLDSLPGGWLTANATFCYGAATFAAGSEPDAAVGVIKRDVRHEQQILQLLAAYFQPPDEQTPDYTIRSDDAIYPFLTGQMAQLYEYGEVYASDRLRGRRAQPGSVRVGLSVADGLLRLDLDTGAFPPEELEALYDSMIRRKTYHKLKNGQFLDLDGGDYEKLAELAHMLRLHPADLKGGSVRLPAFRVPYVDGLLQESESFHIHRDERFQQIIRSFQTVAHGGFALPEGMEPVLRPYQKTGFQWLKTLEAYGFGGILADEMGLGKTVEMLAYLRTVPHAQTGKPSLIVCPASLVLNWGEECARFAPQLRLLTVNGTAAEREKQIAGGDDFDLWVTSYDQLKRDGALYAGQKFYACVLDEAQMVKNQSTLVSRAVKEIDCVQRFVLTGTPIENRLSELWNLFDFLMPGYLYTHTEFVSKLEKPIVRSQDAESSRQLSRLVQPFLLRRLKKDVLRELPAKMEHTRRVELSEEERKVYLAAVADARRTIEHSKQNKIQILAALTRLRQICCDPHLCFENYTGPASKLEACLELCRQGVDNGHQILLFSQFTTMLARIEAALDEQGISHFLLQGATPKEKRAELVHAFNAGGASVFLISLKAGGTGLNLTAADIVIHYDPWWNAAVQNQATDRAHRIGQRAHVQVYKLIDEGTIEEKVLELQAKKASLLDNVTGDNDADLMAMSPEELMALLGSN